MIKIKQAIKTTLRMGGKISFPYKTKISDMVFDAFISLEDSKCVTFIPNEDWKTHISIDAGISYYINKVIRKNNIGLCIYNIVNLHYIDYNLDLHDLTNIDTSELMNIIKKYQTNHFYEDIQ